MRPLNIKLSFSVCGREAKRGILSVMDRTKNSFREILISVTKLSIPAIMAELTSIAMQYIDAAMVGSISAAASASIGLVSSTTWLVGGILISVATGFSVQIAQYTGAGDRKKAGYVFRQGLVTALVMGSAVSLVMSLLSGRIPVLLRGGSDIVPDAGRYLLIYSLALPFVLLRQTAGAAMQCTGDIKTPSVLNAFMCILDMVFNAFLIFDDFRIFGMSFKGAGLGVTGAALGTALSEVVICILMNLCACVRNPILRISRKDSFRPEKETLSRAFRIFVPVALEHVVMCGAQVLTTAVVAPLGTTAVAANSLAVTAESLCYMPGYGIQSAATALTGQAAGAKDRVLAKRTAWSAVSLGIFIMSINGALMYVLSPALFRFLTSAEEVRVLGTQVLRIEVLAEPLFAASIVAAGAMRGGGDTLMPSILSFVSMWGVRIPLTYLLTPSMGLHGVWVAMCIELNVRGLLFIIRLARGRWLSRSLI